MSMDMFEYAAAMDAGQFNNDRSMHRNPDHQTSIDASERVAKGRAKLQDAIEKILREHGPMTDGELEKLECFAHYGPSTVRKRRSELFQAGRVAETGEIRARMKEWRAV